MQNQLMVGTKPFDFQPNEQFGIRGVTCFSDVDGIDNLILCTDIGVLWICGDDSPRVVVDFSTLNLQQHNQFRPTLGILSHDGFYFNFVDPIQRKVWRIAIVSFIKYFKTFGVSPQTPTHPNPIVYGEPLIVNIAGSGLRGGVDGNGTIVSWDMPASIVVDWSNEHYYITDAGAGTIRYMYLPKHVKNSEETVKFSNVKTLAGVAYQNSVIVDGIGIESRLVCPGCSTFDISKTILYFVEFTLGSIRR